VVTGCGGVLLSDTKRREAVTSGAVQDDFLDSSHALRAAK
jgi:hypothetical protein